MTRSLMTAALAAAIGLSAASTARAADISGAGATFPFPIYSKWAAEYKKLTGDGLNYQSIGSGAGIKQIQAKTVVFGATDAPLKGEDLAKDGLVQFPMVMGGVVPVVNVEGLKPGELILDGATFAKIYLGEIKSWDDPALKKLNPSLNLPKQAIAPVYRSDGSGTTFLFTNYLAKVSPDFAKKVGAATSVKWPVGIGGKGNEGVAATVTQAKGAIGYVEYAYAKVNKMAHAGLINKAGKPVQPSLATFQAAAANADWSSAPGFGVILTEQPGEASWPITGATFILVHERPANPAGVTTALKFFAWALEKGQPMAEALDYVPLPPKVVADIETSWSKIIGPDGKPVWSK